MNVIGFAGWEAYDILLYMSRTLVRLGYRVLIIDFSDTGALTKAIYHGIDLDSRKDMVHCRNINYLRRIPNDEELMIFREGVTLINYGLNYLPELTLSCSFLYIIVNTYPHIIDMVNTVMQSSRWMAGQRKLLIRDIITIDDIDRVNSELKFQCDCNQDYLFLDLDDHNSAVKCQKEGLTKIIKLSSGMKRYIISQIHGMYPQLKISKIKRALTLVERGR